MISLRAYARRRKCSLQAVQRAIHRERLQNSLARDARGRVQIGDPDLADQEWLANTDLSRAPGYVKTRGAVTPAGRRRRGGINTLAESSAREKHFAALTAELKYGEASHQLVDRDRVLAVHVDVFTRIKTKLLGLPTRTKAALPHLAVADVATIDAIVREVLEELADLPLTPPTLAAPTN